MTEKPSEGKLKELGDSVLGIWEELGWKIYMIRFSKEDGEISLPP